jgi:hypothetical protein
MLKTLSAIAVCAVVLTGPVTAKPMGTHSGGICRITDSSGMSGAVSCGSGPNQASCTADGACSFRISKQNWEVPYRKPATQGQKWKLTPDPKG